MSSTTQVSSTAVVAEPSAARTAALAMFGILLVSYTLMSADRYLISMLGPDIRAALGLSLPQMGALATMFTFGIAHRGVTRRHADCANFEKDRSAPRNRAVLRCYVALHAGHRFCQHVRVYRHARRRDVVPGNQHVRPVSQLFLEDPSRGSGHRQHVLWPWLFRRALGRRQYTNQHWQLADADGGLRADRYWRGDPGWPCRTSNGLPRPRGLPSIASPPAARIL